MTSAVNNKVKTRKAANRVLKHYSSSGQAADRLGRLHWERRAVRLAYGVVLLFGGPVTRHGCQESQNIWWTVRC